MTNARTEVSDYPFTTLFPVPGMLDHYGAAIQLVDTPPFVSGLAQGEGSGPRLLQLIRGADAAGILVDLSEEPLHQMELVRQELATAHIRLLPRPNSTVLELRAKGGIKFRGVDISKDERITAARMLGEHGITNAEVVVRSHLALDELASQLARERLLPAIIVGTKNDLPGAHEALAQLRAQYGEFDVIDVNFLDATNFDRLQASLFGILGLVRVFLVERPASDAPETILIVPRASSIGDVIEHIQPSRLQHPVLARIWGPSVRHPGQAVGLDHLVKDGDRVHVQS
jgi:ribosome-interacting GTPase 1